MLFGGYHYSNKNPPVIEETMVSETEFKLNFFIFPAALKFSANFLLHLLSGFNRNSTKMLTVEFLANKTVEGLNVARNIGFLEAFRRFFSNYLNSLGVKEKARDGKELTKE